ncbi:hypothetical protein [Acidovorax sp. SUPP2825]|uniref:hypothetical protein n=1 Tax=Acidovorax sp. SUPP2825 TaxID=2920879 RepID=UPI0023DE1B9D|nr:hypothetical protein [Acidovorax sp. SUPP2825]GKS96928.1 hypothetical protein AVAK2825_20355 [Acidovorax sp. SUPP2825]
MRSTTVQRLEICRCARDMAQPLTPGRPIFFRVGQELASRADLRANAQELRRRIEAWAASLLPQTNAGALLDEQELIKRWNAWQSGKLSHDLSGLEG